MLLRNILDNFLRLATCEEVVTMVGENYIRCGRKATAIVKHTGRDEGPYALCEFCASHNVNNRGGVMVYQRRRT